MKISIHEPFPLSAVSYYRSVGVMSYLYKLNKNIKIDIPTQINWNSLSGTDILYCERPQQDSDLKAIRIAKDFNIKIWVDYDDLLHEIPYYNPSWFFYNKGNAKQNMEKALELADIITVSTSFLKEYYSKFNQNIHVIENAHNDYRYPFVFREDNCINEFFWRGSNTHRRDILSVAQNIFNLSKQYPKWHWTFIGNDLWFIVDYVKNMYHIMECDVIDYNKILNEIKSTIHLNPLIDSNFNKSKSNISWLEATFAGAVAVCPDFVEFNKPGCVNYKNSMTETEDIESLNSSDSFFKNNESFQYLMEKCIKSKEFRQKNYKLSYEYIKENLLLSIINKKRIEIIEKLI